MDLSVNAHFDSTRAADVDYYYGGVGGGVGGVTSHPMNFHPT